MSKTKNWKAFGSKYIKADDVTSDKDEYAITGVDSENEDGKETLIYTIQRDEISKLFGCNATNEKTVREECPEGPEQAIGRKITFNKVEATNPQTHEIVDGLRIKFVKEDDGRVPAPEAEEVQPEAERVTEDETMNM